MKNPVPTISHRQIHLVGAGISSLASAAYFIRGCHIPGDQDKKSVPIYRGDHHADVLFEAAKTIFR